MKKFLSNIVKGINNPKQASFYMVKVVARNIFKFMPYSISRIFEEAAAFSQGKGWSGSRSIQQEIEVVNQLLGKRPQLAIDIGGNIGNYSAELRLLHNELEIHTFEPSGLNIKKLNKRFLNDPLIKIIPLAVSNIAGSATLFSNAPGSGLGSLTKRDLSHLKMEFDSQEYVSTIRFEDYWKKELSSRRLDIVKIDVEGHELSVLEGFGEAINAVSILQFEFGGCNIDTRTFFHDFWKFFSLKQFDIFRITPAGIEKINSYREIDEFFSTTNFVAKNRNSR